MNLQEDYCSFELSKLLKEKGFDEECDWFYEEVGDLNRRTRNGCDKYINSLLDYGEYAAPTHQMAMKWLREKNILISVVSALGIYEEHIEGYVACVDTMTDNVLRCKQEILRDTYEEAVEAAIRWSLKNLI